MIPKVSKQDRHGVVLLIVLGMLSLFTVLVISFVVFSSQMARTAYSNKERQRTAIPVDEPIESALLQLVVGTNNPRSAAFGHSLLEDMYGNDGVQMRVGHLRGNVNRNNLPITLYNQPALRDKVAGTLLLPIPRDGSGNINGTPETTLFKFPTNLVSWYDEGELSNPAIDRSPGYASLSPVNTYRYHIEQRPDLDDVFAGRLVTFDEGPLAGVTFRVIRSFGRQNGEPEVARQNNLPAPPLPVGRTLDDVVRPDPTDNTNAPYNNPNNYVAEEYLLAGCFVIDLSEMPSEEIEFQGTQQPLYDVADRFPNALLYSPGPDGQPGRAGVDDNGDNVIDDAGEFGAPYSDDIGYGFTMNGVPFNGRGLNPSGLTGIGRDGVVVDPFADMELQQNAALMGGTIRPGNFASTGRFPEPDEQWDAAGLENWFLAYQPSDHRRVDTTSPTFVPVYPGTFNETELHRQLGQNVIPSFHRPSVINYLMNAPIWIEEDIANGIDRSNPANQRNFATIVASPNLTSPTNDHLRLAALIRRIRRATTRPLNISHQFLTGGARDNYGDLDGDGVSYDGAPGFSGSNPVPVMSQTLDLSVDLSNMANFNQTAQDLRALATWLVNGPWDVDNDGDGLPDSVWTDMGLPDIQAPDGTLIRPLVAPLIEDMDGKLNLNFAGNLSQLVKNRFVERPTSGGRSDRRYFNETEYFSVQQMLGSFGFGGGVGPGEVDFSHLFSSDSVPGGFIGPLPTSQVGTRLSFRNNATNIGLLRSRYGNLLNVRNGGQIYDYLAPYPGLNEHKLPAAGDAQNPLRLSSALSKIPFPTPLPVNPTDPLLHGSYSYWGRPMDLMGVSTTRKDHRGNQQFTLGVVPPGVIPNSEQDIDDKANHVYELGVTSPLGDDTPYTPTEYIDLLQNGRIGGRLSELLGDAVRRNAALRNLITVESRSVDSPEVPGAPSLGRLLAEKLRIASVPYLEQQVHLDRMLAVELRKGSKLNVNRALGNGENSISTQLFTDGRTPTNPGAAFNPVDPDIVVDESREGQNRVVSTGGPQPNNVRSNERAFPVIAGSYPQQATANAKYAPTHYMPVHSTTAPGTPMVPDFDGYDLNGDGILDTTNDVGTMFSVDHDNDSATAPLTTMLKAPTGEELLARHLYVLMFTLIHDPITHPNGIELVRHFPYPGGAFGGNTNNPTAAEINNRNHYVANRLAQWAVNVVDFRDTNVARTRLRFDLNPFDGFNPEIAAVNVVWGMERPEVELTEAIAFHDKRLKRNLETNLNLVDADGELKDDVDNDPANAPDPDSDMDQFRIPLASAFVELHSLRSPDDGNAVVGQESFPREFYNAVGELELGRVVGSGSNISPVWRLAVGAPTGGDANKSTRWLFDANRLHDLASNDGRIEETSHLEYDGNQMNDYDPMAAPPTAPSVNDARDDWNEGIRHSVEIATPPFPLVAGTERVRLANPDYSTAGAGTRDFDVFLERFVLFSNVTPSATLDVMNPTSALRSGMNVSNVYYNPQQIQIPGNPNPTIAPAVLGPGEYGIVAPRVSTVLGQTRNSNSSTTPNYLYSPVEQRFEFALQGATIDFRLNYRDLGPLVAGANSNTPRYFEDHANYHIRRVRPFICESLYPHQVDPMAVDPVSASWSTYFGDPRFAPENRVDMGFNISAPLPGPNYYPAPTQRILTMNADNYPLADGYRDYESLTGLHPDVPFDHEAGRPLNDNSYTVGPASNEVLVTWSAVGTHQDARTIFLQRLADPTRPFHPVDNPYLTEDFIPVDLTTYNGEEDVRTPVDRDGDGDPTNDNYFADQARSFYDDMGMEFTPPVKMDSRRKIPAVGKDRPFTALIPNGSAGTGIAATFDRVTGVHRSPFSATFNVLRRSQTRVLGGPPAAPRAYWEFEIGSTWYDQDRESIDGSGMGNDDGIETRYSPNLTFDDDVNPAAPRQQFKQTLGYVNREYGFPIRFGQPQATSGNNATANVGMPQDVAMLSLPWLNRDFQSPMELINVPAVSRTSLLATFTPGTLLDVDSGTQEWRERTTPFGHLLGFESGYSKFRGADIQQDVSGTYTNRLPLGNTEDAQDPDYLDNVGQFTGDRAGFEQIFDYIDIGPVWFDSQRWFDPIKVVHRTDSLLSGQTVNYQQRAQLFNRVVTTLQPPYNYVGKHRTPGKINLNTTPDYIRKGPGFQGTDPSAPPAVLAAETRDRFLDALELPDTPASTAPVVNLLRANPTNLTADNDGFTPEFRNSRLFGNGSVYRSLAYGFSTQYELDSYFDTSAVPQFQINYGAPSVMGENNAYERTVDSPFGRSFKAFIESRRGYPHTLRGAANLLNPELDWRYPTRFAGVFGAARSSSLGSVQRFMRADETWTGGTDIGSVRRTHDMGLLRPHPDFDERLIPLAVRDQHNDTTTDPTTYSVSVNSPSATGGDASFALVVEYDPTADAINDGGQPTNDTTLPATQVRTDLPADTYNTSVAVNRHKISMLNSGLFERPQAELHSNFRHLNRDSKFRFENAARLANLTTNHSNVFLIRMTTSYFVVDPITGAVGQEYVDATGEPVRSKATFMVDRSIPVGFLRGKTLNARNTVIYSEVQE
ncbi:hypothetical protein [Planctomycetes bacterium TBK1r]|uniref:Uncharacterized protein n=1 Tax=Stieleria magnilauensis TaxID=2527963 RepID=A0ABX5XLU0_9BACT|nr:hypothetical protein TBK1r_17430 [Planctomycetes bacterium TBK1r]